MLRPPQPSRDPEPPRNRPPRPTPRSPPTKTKQTQPQANRNLSKKVSHPQLPSKQRLNTKPIQQFQHLTNPSSRASQPPRSTHQTYSYRQVSNTKQTQAPYKRSRPTPSPRQLSTRLQQTRQLRHPPLQTTRQLYRPSTPPSTKANRDTQRQRNTRLLQPLRHHFHRGRPHRQQHPQEQAI